MADVLDLPHRNDQFDFVISIAVIHHLSTRERRVAAISSLLANLRPPSKADTDRVNHDGGRGLLYVWALEQRESRRGWGEGDTQDVMVPWVMKAKASGVHGGSTDKTVERYYHLYRKGELELEIDSAGGQVIESGYEKDNWWAVVGRR